MEKVALMILLESIKAGALKGAGSSLGVSLLAKDCLLAAQVLDGTAKVDGGASFNKDRVETRGRPRKPQVTPITSTLTLPADYTPEQFMDGILGKGILGKEAT